MPRLTYDPAVHLNAGEPFLQTVHLFTDDKRPLGRARWHAGSPTDGAAQILDLTILPEHRRQGHGRTLLRAVIAQITAYHKLHKSKPRRLWLAVPHKDLVIGRAFLTSEGFMHIVTVAQLFRGQDALIYIRTFD